MTTLIDKPEILTVVFEYLDTLELLNASSVCILWRKASEVSWKNRFPLFRCGVRTKRQFLRRWRREQEQFWKAHQLASEGEPYFRPRQLRIAAQAKQHQFLIRFSYPRFDGVSWNGIVPLKSSGPIVDMQGEGSGEGGIIGFRLEFDMRDLSFSTGKSSWERMFTAFYPFNKRSHDVLQEIRDDPDCHFPAGAFEPDALFITIVAFNKDDDDDDDDDGGRCYFSTLVPCQSCVMEWGTSQEHGCLPITYGGYISYLGNLRFGFLGEPGVTDKGASTFKLETMSLSVYGGSLTNTLPDTHNTNQ